MRQIFQMDKVVIGRSKFHNLYAILPSDGCSWGSSLQPNYTFRRSYAPEGIKKLLNEPLMASSDGYMSAVEASPSSS
jgi:hypothetical protein